MRRALCALSLAALAGCGLRYKFTQPPGGEELQRYKEDKAACTERGYALQTYSGGWSAVDGSGGGYGRTRFNGKVYVSCMEARGWEYKGRVPTVFGTALY